MPLCHAASGCSSTISWSRLAPCTVPGSDCWAKSSCREWKSLPDAAVSLNATTLSSQDSSAASSTGYVKPVVEGLLYRHSGSETAEATVSTWSAISCDTRGM